jgi:hypothetical protein
LSTIIGIDEAGFCVQDYLFAGGILIQKIGADPGTGLKLFM